MQDETVSIDTEEEDTDETTSGSKRTKEGSRSHHAVVYNAEWELEFPWLVSVKDECGRVTGMLCPEAQDSI